MATKTALEQRNKKIRAANEAFEKLSPARKRVAIARDVLAQIGSRLKVTQGTYVSSNEISKIRRQGTVTKNTQIQKLLRKVETCEVCAKGALFICGIDRANKLRIADLESDVTRTGQFYGSDVTNYLERFFDSRQLDLIESAFEVADMAEGNEGRDEWSELPDDVEQAVEFGRLFREEPYDDESKVDADGLLRAIMENIIVNKGTFKPEIHPVKRWVTEGFRG